MSIFWIFLGCAPDNVTDGFGSHGFKQLDSQTSGILFQNTITISDSLNYNTFPYIYMGGGVALGDIDNDGLTDVFLTGNMAPNKLYRNKGNITFEDISKIARVEGDSRWYTGATMVDINEDGWLDIYVSVSGMGKNTPNQLFVNNGDLTFTEKAKEYGIDDNSNSIQSTFFDYDNDGDLDLYVANYPIIPLTQPNAFYYDLMQTKEHRESGHLFRNEGNGTFQDVTHESGVLNFGLSLGVVVSDFNNDGWKDLYISNDFAVPDYLYLNNGNGTFSEKIKQSSNQTSMFGMGVDAADFNNDGLMDVLQMDMTPEDHYRAKTNMANMDRHSFYSGVSMGFHYQYMQNSLQLNNGIDGQKTPFFSNIARYSGVATTDWSWGGLLADFDNDGLKDIVITNGMRLDVNNNDLLNTESRTTLSRPNIDMHKAPVTPINNYLYRNKNGYKFEDVSEKWNANTNGFSNGIAYGDLDNDGDLDLVINNIDDKATILKNNLPKSNYLRLKLKGSPKNPMSIGAKVKITTGEVSQWFEHTLSRGFQSSMEPILHFGLGNTDTIDEIRIEWPDGKLQYIKNATPNTVLEINYDPTATVKDPTRDHKKNFKDLTMHTGVDFIHDEDFYDDFLVEPLLPHKNSNLGPGLAVGDVNNDGLDDFFIGNARNKNGELFIQTTKGTFEKLQGPWEDDKTHEDTGAIFLDVDNDGDQDLYVVSGGNMIGIPSEQYKDRLYINTEEGFKKSERSLPEIYTSGATIAPYDYDNDGDLDLFIGGRIKPGYYLQKPNSYLLRNEGGKDTDVTFKDVTQDVMPKVSTIGLVTDALWHDYDDDGKTDLILVGEWMPITFFKNEGNNFIDFTEELGFEDTVGWWYSLAKEDLDNDGDLDLVAGNLGLNSKYKTSEKAPFEIFVSDFDGNQRQDIVLSVTKKGNRFPLRGRQCSSEQIPMIKRNFKTYDLFASANLEDIYGEEMLKKATYHKVDTFAHTWFENLGEGKYERHPLPIESQFSSINNITFLDYDKDEFTDILISGNLYDMEVETPRVDAGVGLVLKNNKGKGFETVPYSKSGLMVKGEVKAVKPLKIGKNKQQTYLFAINDDRLRVQLFIN